jgi:hypothetical protein
VHNQLIGIIRVKQQINKYRNIHLIIVLLHLYPSSWNNLENEKRIYPYIRIIFESWNHKIQTGFWIWIGFLKLQIGSLNLIWILSTKLDVKWEIEKKETTALGPPLLRASQSPCLGPTQLLPLAPTFSTSRTGPIAWPLLFRSVTRGPSMSVGWLCVPAETASCPLSLPHGLGRSSTWSLRYPRRLLGAGFNSMAKTSPGAVLHRVHRKSATDHLQSRADLRVGPTIGVPIPGYKTMAWTLFSPPSGTE